MFQYNHDGRYMEATTFEIIKASTGQSVHLSTSHLGRSSDRAEVTAWSVKCLSFKHEVLDLDPQPSLKMLGTAACMWSQCWRPSNQMIVFTLSAHTDSWTLLLASQPSTINEHQGRERYYPEINTISKNEGESDWTRCLTSMSSLHIHVHTHTSHEHIHTKITHSVKSFIY